MAVKHMPMSSLIIGIDLDPIRAIKGCKTLVGDITTQKSRQVCCAMLSLLHRACCFAAALLPQLLMCICYAGLIICKMNTGF